MKMMMWILPTALMALMSMGGCDNKPQARSDSREIRVLVDGIMVEYGGEEAMGRVMGYQAEGIIHATQWKVNATTRRWFKRPDCLLLELDYPNRPEWRLTRGRLGWTGPANGNWKVAGMPKIWPMRLQTVRFDLPLRLREHESGLELLQDDEQNRRVLRLTIDEGLHMEYHIDTETHRILTVMMVMDGPPAMVFQANYADFRMVEGVLFPHHEETWARGTMTSLIRIKSIEINPENLDQRVAAPEETTTDGMI